MSTLAFQIPTFPHEEPARLLIHQAFDPNAPENLKHGLIRKARVEDIVDAMREADLEVREQVARLICPELVDRLAAAEHVVEHAMDVRSAGANAERYIARYGEREYRSSAPVPTREPPQPEAPKVGTPIDVEF